MDNIGRDNSTKKVLVGLTGRVGSSVAAFLLKKQGFNVIGVTIVTNVDDSFSDSKYYPKCHITNLESIKEFCNTLSIPFYATDAKSQFENDVIDPLLGNKLLGQANASCFNCTEMRLKIMYAKMKALKADYIATGHFGKIHKNLNSDDYFVHSNNDPESDQSHLLTNLENKLLKHLMLPLGELKKLEIEKIANKFNLKLVSEENKSTFCFQNKESYTSFAKTKIPKSLQKEGQVINVNTENVHGDHTGMLNHYVTESELDFKGLLPNDSETMIIGFDFDKSLIEIGNKENLTFKGTQLINLHMGESIDRKKPITCYLKSKQHNKLVKGNLYFKNNNSAIVDFFEEQYPIVKGEIFVIYDRDTRNAKVIGSAKVGNKGEFKLIDRVDDFRTKEEDMSDDRVFKF